MEVIGFMKQVFEYTDENELETWVEDRLAKEFNQFISLGDPKEDLLDRLRFEGKTLIFLPPHETKDGKGRVFEVDYDERHPDQSCNLNRNSDGTFDFNVSVYHPLVNWNSVVYQKLIKLYGT